MQEPAQPPAPSEPSEPAAPTATGREQHPGPSPGSPPVSTRDAAPTVAPPVADGVHHQLDPRSIAVNRFSGAIANTIFAGILFWVLVGSFLGALFEGGPALWVAMVGGPAWLTLASLLAWLTWRMPEISYRHESYCVDVRGIEIRRGIFWRRVINVPLTRVQHLDVSQGPLERRFGLGTLVIHTAGTQHAKVELSGLEHGRALRIREHLLPGGTTSDAV